MRIAVVSDTHFGDGLCTLVSSGGVSEPDQTGPAYVAFKRAVGRVDYLVLLGDIIDFSVASYEAAYRSAKVFFQQIQRDGLAGQIVYLPGNHDFDIWSVIEQQVNVINQVKQGQLPRPFRRSVPGLIDDRQPEARFALPDVPARPEWHEKSTPYGGLFLDHLTRTGSPDGRSRASGRKLTFNFAYPNLYVITSEGECVLLTHGHYLEAFWSLGSEVAMELAGDDLELETRGLLTIQEMVGINLPLSQLACSGIGQAHPLTEVARRVHRETMGGRVDALQKYLDRLEEALKRALPRRTWPARLLRSYALRWLKGRLLDVVRTSEEARYSREFFDRPAVRSRFRGYFQQSLSEIARLRRQHGLDIPAPTHVVFGHTHQPIPWGSDELFDSVDDRPVRFCNTGGWLYREEADLSRQFAGAEVVLYETGRGFRSIPIRSCDLEPDARASDTQSPGAGS
jgi:UDP-2,3-diacylglucosamine pyrophosphatase LpxH